MSLIQLKNAVNLTEIMLRRKARTLPYTNQFWATSVQDRAVCWGLGNLFSWRQQGTYSLLWADPGKSSWALAPCSCGMLRRWKDGEESCGWRWWHFNRESKSCVPKQSEKGIDSSLPIGRQVCSCFPESWAFSMPGGGLGSGKQMP